MTNCNSQNLKSQLEEEFRISLEASEAAFAAERAAAAARAEKLLQRIKLKEEEEDEALRSIESMKKTLKQKEEMIQNLMVDEENDGQSGED